MRPGRHTSWRSCRSQQLHWPVGSPVPLAKLTAGRNLPVWHSASWARCSLGMRAPLLVLNAAVIAWVSFRSSRLQLVLLPCRVRGYGELPQIDTTQIEEVFTVCQSLGNEADQGPCLVSVGAFRERELLLPGRGHDPGARVELRDLLIADVGRAREIDEHRPVALGHHPHAR